MTFAIIKKHVIKFTVTIMVRIMAIRSASLSSAPDFSPSALAHILHNLDFIYFLEAEYACPPKNAATIAATETKYVAAMSPNILDAPSNPIQSASTTANG